MPCAFASQYLDDRRRAKLRPMDITLCLDAVVALIEPTNPAIASIAHWNKLREMVAVGRLDVWRRKDRFASRALLSFRFTLRFTKNHRCQGGEIGRRARLRIWWSNP